MKSLTRYIAFAWIGAVLLLVAAQIFVPQRSGFLALTEVFEPYIVLTALIAAPFALLGRTKAAADLQAISTHVVCNGLSDHCLLAAAFK